MRTDVLIVGGGTGGVAAALAVARRGATCVVTEPTDWIGGQLTSQAVPPDENPWIEGKQGVQGATRSYLEYRERVRAWYREHRVLTPAARANAHLNPGGGWVSDLCHEPRIGVEVLRAMLAPYAASGKVKIVFGVEPVRAETAGDRVRAVVVRDAAGKETTIEAAYVLDATEIGDVLKLGGVEYFAGSEARSVHGELHGSDVSDVHDVQAVSWCFAIEHRPGEDHTISRPERYEFWRDWVPPLTPAWPGKLFSWVQVGGAEHKARLFKWKPWPEEPEPGEWEMWRYRRIVDNAIFSPEARLAHPDVALVNMVQMDYFLKPTLEVSDEARRQAFAEAKEQARCFLYWMQTDAPRLDGTDKIGFPGLRLRGDEVGTTDGFAKHPYIREARRLDALTVVTERHVGTEQRAAEGLVRTFANAPKQGVGESFEDSVGIGYYRLDLHPSSAMKHSLYVEATPFRIPLGALIPKRMTNLLAAGKCLGVTHITNGCYRLHPVEWNVGESAGHLAAYCLAKGVTPRQVREDRTKLRELQGELVGVGVALEWPWEEGAGLK